MSSASRSQCGFTLVELVVVIVVLGILSVGTVRFVRDASDGYSGTVSRTELGSTTRLTVERIARELRNALPNSARVTGTCIEFIPVVGGSTYLNAPVAVAASGFDAIPPLLGATPGAVRVAVFPDVAAAVYTLAADGVVSPVATFAPPDGDNIVHVTFASAHRFPAESPQRRFYVVATPVSYCLVGDRLWRYQNYGFSTAQPLPAALPSAMPGRGLVGEGLDGAIVPFSVAGATLTRNAEVAMRFLFADGSDGVAINHVVQLRNVP